MSRPPMVKLGVFQPYRPHTEETVRKMKEAAKARLAAKAAEARVYAGRPNIEDHGVALWVRIVLTSGETVDGTMPVNLLNLDHRGLSIRLKAGNGKRNRLVTILRRAIASAEVLGVVGAESVRRKAG